MCLLNQTLNRFFAQKANRYSIDHYDHTVVGYMENSPNDTGPNVSAQQTEKFFIKPEYTFNIDSTNRKLQVQKHKNN